MPFARIPRISWADLHPGQIAGYGIIGDPAHAHLVLGSDGAGSDGLRLYGPDGTTVLVDIRADGTATFKGTVEIGSTVPASSVSGTVATATTATDLGGGGTASGQTTIAGELIVGNPAAAHVVVGTDGAGADGVRLYAADGVTPLIDLNIANGPIIRTGSGTTYVEMSAASQDRITFVEAGLVAGEIIASNGLLFSGATGFDTAPTFQAGATSQDDINLAAGKKVTGAGFASRLASFAQRFAPFGPNDNTQHYVNGGGIAVTTDGSGQAVINHGMSTAGSPVSPTAVVANIIGAASQAWCTVSNINSTSFTVTVWTPAGASAGSARTISWMAFA